MRNRRGWIKIIEVFTAIMIIMSVLLVVINKEYIDQGKASERIYDAEISILYSIATDYILKQKIFQESTIPNDVVDKIEKATPSYLNCAGITCDQEEESTCEFGENIIPQNKEIYSQSIKLRYTPSQGNSQGATPLSKILKISCWIK